MWWCRKRARTARGRMVVRPRWPGEDTTPSASHDDSDAYSSPDEASPWTGPPQLPPSLLLQKGCIQTFCAVPFPGIALSVSCRVS